MLTDTDSLVYKIKTHGIYKDFNEDKNLFNLRDYPQDTKFFDPVKNLLIKWHEFKCKIMNLLH